MHCQVKMIIKIVFSKANQKGCAKQIRSRLKMIKIKPIMVYEPRRPTADKSLFQIENMFPKN